MLSITNLNTLSDDKSRFFPLRAEVLSATYQLYVTSIFIYVSNL